MELAYFTSSVSREDYAIIKDEAYKLDVTIKKHISNIIHDYAEQKRKEAINKQQAAECSTNN